MQTQGSLQESNLAALLQTMQSERATGTLSLESGGDNAALYFLFGHLFHAAGPRGEGEEVVVRAIGWNRGTFHFDPRAKLPAEETIKSTPAELISMAEERAPTGAAADGLESASERGGAPALHAIEGRGRSPQEEERTAPAWAPAPTTPAEPVRSPAWSPSRPEVEAPAPAPAPSPQTWSPAVARPQAEPELARPAAVYSPTSYTPPYTRSPMSTTAAAGAAPGAAGASSPEPVGALPIPAGRVQYEGLKSGFVDFPRLLRTLRNDRHTGYLRLSSSSTNGVLVFREGDLVEAEASHGSSLSHGEDAFLAFRRQMDTGEGMLDVIDLEPDTVAAVSRLLTGPSLFTGLLGRFINFGALLEYLAEEGIDGSVIVHGGGDTGVILLQRGGVLAAYTSAARQPLTSTDAVAGLAGNRAARIEVRGHDSDRGPIDTEAALSRPY